MILTEGN